MLKHALVKKMFKNVHKMFLIMCFSSICIFWLIYTYLHCQNCTYLRCLLWICIFFTHVNPLPQKDGWEWVFFAVLILWYPATDMIPSLCSTPAVVYPRSASDASLSGSRSKRDAFWCGCSDLVSLDNMWWCKVTFSQHIQHHISVLLTS